MRAERLLGLAIAGVLAAGVAGAFVIEEPSPEPTATSNLREVVPTVDSAAQVRVEGTGLEPIERTEPLSLGVTHLRYLEHGEVLARSGLEHNQFIMGFGALNPSPAPGVRDFSSLDTALGRLRATGDPISITLCCAPDWMKGGSAGTTDFSRIDEAPRPEHFDDFAALAGEIAARYPFVAKFQVWSELRGFYDADRNRWDYEAYTDLYNRVYDAIKAVRPDAQVGGPYVVMDSWSTGGSHPSDVRGPWGVIDQRALDVIEHWLEHARGADFVSIDGRLGTKDKGWITHPVESLAKIDAVIGWLRARTDLPVQWAELYVVPEDSPLDAKARTAVLAAAAVHLARAGADSVLVWGVDPSSPRVDTPLVDDTGTRTETARMVELLRPVLADPNRHVLVDQERQLVALAGEESVVVIDLSGEDRTVAVEGVRVELQAWEVVSVTR